MNPDWEGRPLWRSPRVVLTFVLLTCSCIVFSEQVFLEQSSAPPPHPLAFWLGLLCADIRRVMSVFCK